MTADKKIFGKTFTIAHIDDEDIKFEEQAGCWTPRYYEMELINSTNLTSMSNPLNSFLLSLKSEPDKSLIKSGLMNADGTLTSEGKQVYDMWQFNKNKEAFKTEVADPILEEMKAK